MKKSERLWAVQALGSEAQGVWAWTGDQGACFPGSRDPLGGGRPGFCRPPAHSGLSTLRPQAEAKSRHLAKLTAW